MTSPIRTAADAMIADNPNPSPYVIRILAHEIMAAYGCTYAAAKSALVRAIKRSTGELGSWGGSRGGGRPRKVEEVSE